jgi:hypothetical protein
MPDKIIACCLVAIALSGQIAGGDEPNSQNPIALTSANYEDWREHILPTSAELAPLRSIPWLPTFAEGLAAAADQSKPVLLWTMNGHPLGCT